MNGWTEYTCDGNDYVPVEEWGRDHWSTFLYLETRAVDAQGRIDNSRMRCHSRLHRPFAHTSSITGQIQDGSAYPTRLKEGEIVKHDDWSCLEDMVAAGLIRAFWRKKSAGGFALGHSVAKVEFLPKGHQIVGALRVHKMTGLSLEEFEVSQ